MYSILLQTGGQGVPFNLIFMGLLIAVMYLFFIRPQAKKQKSQMKFLEELKKGDEVVTGSGVIGKITKLDERTVTLQVSQKGYLDVMRTSVSREMTEAYQK